MMICSPDNLTEEDIKRIINNQILEDWVKDKAKEVYKEEKEKETQEIINQANRREGTI